MTADTTPEGDTSVSILAAVAERADEQGRVRLHESEIPFFTTTEGTRWLEQVGLEDDSYRITDAGRQALAALRDTGAR